MIKELNADFFDDFDREFKRLCRASVLLCIHKDKKDVLGKIDKMTSMLLDFRNNIDNFFEEQKRI